MSVGYNPKIVTDGLVLCLDAANSKSYNQAENLYPNSESLSTFLSGPTGYTYTTSASGGPFGGFAATITSTDAANSYMFEWGNTITLAAGDTVTQSWYVKNVLGVDKVLLRFWTGAGRAWTTARSVVFNLSAQTTSVNEGTIVNSSISKLSNNWYRLSMTATADQAGYSAMSVYMSGNFSVGSSFSVAGAQLTKKIGPSTYTPTTGTAVTPTTTWKDLISSSSCTLTAAPSYNSSGNGSITFNGSTQETQLLNTNYPTNAIDPFSVETAIYIPSAATWTNTYYGNILTRGSYAGSHGLWRHSTNNILSMYVRQNNPYAATEALATITRDTWYHVIGTWDGYYPKIYINGSLVSTGYLMASTTTYTSDYWVVGAVKAAGGADGNRFQGNIANAKVYNRALSANEVLQNFNAVRGRFGL